ncbi:hypothetical protein C8R44DRAFT_749086 [Mycena epipterygia]|nr:hypothetical protein C8R44DRAFT_749086 [Mycena epipterygia]
MISGESKWVSRIAQGNTEGRNASADEEAIQWGPDDIKNAAGIKHSDAGTITQASCHTLALGVRHEGVRHTPRPRDAAAVIAYAMEREQGGTLVPDWRMHLRLDVRRWAQASAAASVCGSLHSDSAQRASGLQSEWRASTAGLILLLKTRMNEGLNQVKRMLDRKQLATPCTTTWSEDRNWHGRIWQQCSTHERMSRKPGVMSDMIAKGRDGRAMEESAGLEAFDSEHLARNRHPQRERLI